MSVSLHQRRLKRKFRVKKKAQANLKTPRMTIFRSTKHIYAQIIDDNGRKTLVSASTQSKEFRDSKESGGNLKAAQWVGTKLGEKALEQGIKEIHCDRNGYIYAGRIKALADAVREKGIKF